MSPEIMSVYPLKTTRPPLHRHPPSFSPRKKKEKKKDEKFAFFDYLEHPGPLSVLVNSENPVSL